MTRVDKHVPLTQSQMMIWIGQRLDPAPLYNMVLTFKIDGMIDVDRFKKAFQKLVDNNDVLRSEVTLKDNIPHQLFYDKLKSPLEYIDLSGSDTGYQECQSWVEENKSRQFEVGEILYHSVLFKIKEDCFIWYLNQHHLITDGGAIKYVYDELNRYYQAGLDSDLEHAVHTFESYAQQHPFRYEQLTNPYWTSRLEKIPVPPSLYGGKPENPSSKSTRINIDLGKERTQRLRALTQDTELRSLTVELALSHIFLAAIFTLIYKIGDQDEFAIGVPYQNRSSAKEKQTAGLFMELLPIEAKVEEGETLLSLFKKLRKNAFEVMKNVVDVKPPVDLLKAFNVVLNYIPVTLSDFAGIPMECDWLLSGHVDANHHLRLQIQDFNDAGEYKLQFDLNDKVFSKEQINYVGDHFIRVIDAFIEDKNQRIQELSLISQAEVERIGAWNNTAVVYEEGETLLSKFEQQVEKTPNNIALIFEQESLTYETLNAKANRVADFLIQRGVSKNDIIAVSLERSLEMMIYIYGIIKAGAAYLPVDTDTPVERLNFILEDSDARILFYNHEGISTSTLEKVDGFRVETIEEAVALLKDSNKQIQLQPDDLAYLIYTSGSTGEPKGVKCHHRGICNRLNWMNTDYPISVEDILLQKTPITFDVSLGELFGALQVGAKLVVESPDGHQSPEKLIRTIQDHKVTVVHFVPSMLNVFIDARGVENCRSLRRILCSGEALSIASVEKAYAKLDVNIYNLYGPTEAAVEVSSWYCDKNETATSIPIGYPTANTQLHILDENLNMLPIGVSGELHIAGTQVAHGYLNREALTKERFIKDIFLDSSDARMYKTGDKVRYRADGAIEYLGRIDNQIKLRGLRIELGEIETNIERHTDVSQAIVKVNEQENLVAYYTGKKLLEDEIKNLIAKRLPAYMIPSVFVHLDKFEFLSSGKVNRKKLPDHSIKESERTRSFLAPTNEIEELLADIWKEVLHIEKVGVDESFIALGGHSLDAIRVTARVHEELDIEFKLNTIFELPTVREYAKFIEETIVELLDE